MIGSAPDEEYTDPHGECAAEISRLTAALAAAEEKLQWERDALELQRDNYIALEAHNAVLREALELLQDTITKTSAENFKPPFSVEKQLWAQDLWFKARRKLEEVLSSTPASGSLDRIRREGAEAAAKVVEPFRKSENGSVRYAAAIIIEHISALYSEVAPHQEKETR